MILRRWEVRSNTLADVDFGDTVISRFFFRVNAENDCTLLNDWKSTAGYMQLTYFIHDRRQDV